jgi:hypothetical protein
MPSSILLRVVPIRLSTIEILPTLTQTSGCGDLQRVSPASVISTSVRLTASISVVVPVATIAGTAGSAVRRVTANVRAV